MNKLKLLKKEFVTHDVMRFVFEKPRELIFEPGQATELALEDSEEWRPFTFVSSPNDSVLEFLIKIYSGHDGVTKKFAELEPGDFVKQKDIFGSIKYKGPGIFIAGGAGITPFIPILKELSGNNEENKKNRLIFSNKESGDIIMEKELRGLLPKEDLILTLTRGNISEGDYVSGRVDDEFLKKYVKDFNQNFYVCGPPRFVKEIRKILEGNGVSPENIIFEGN